MKIIEEKIKEWCENMDDYGPYVEWIRQALQEVEKEARQEGYDRGVKKGISFTRQDMYKEVASQVLDEYLGEYLIPLVVSTKDLDIIKRTYQQFKIEKELIDER